MAKTLRFTLSYISFYSAQYCIKIFLYGVTLLALLFVITCLLFLWFGEHLGLPPLAPNYIVNFFAVPGIKHSIILSLYVGVCSFILSCIVAYYLLRATLLSTKFGQHYYRYIILITPHSALAIGLVFLFFPTGLLTRILHMITGDTLSWQHIWPIPDYHGVSLILALTFKESIFIYISALTLIQQIPFRAMINKAISLGYHPRQALFYGIMPSIIPQLRLPFAIVIFYCFSVVDISILVGPNTPSLLAVRLVEFMSHRHIEYRYDAVIGAIILWAMMLATYAFIMTCIWLLLQPSIIVRAMRKPYILLTNNITQYGHYTYKITLLTGAIWLCAWSFYGYIGFDNIIADSWSLQAWHVPKQFIEALLNTIIIALSASFIASIIMSLRLFLYCYKSHGYILLPIIMPEILFVFGAYFVMNILYIPTHIVTIIVMHIMYILPYSYLMLKGSFQKTPASYYNHAASLGKNMWQQYWHIALPLNAKAITLSIIVGIAVSCNLYLPSLFMGGFGVIPTLLTENIFYFQSGNPRLLAVVALMNIIVPLVSACVMLILYKYITRHQDNKW